MASAYSVFANGGYKATPYGFTQIMNSSGDVVYDRRKDAPPPKRVLDDNVVKEMNGMLAQVPEWGTGRRAKLDGIRTAGKTGTTSAYRDAWFVGFTGNYTAAVWMGNDSYAPTRRLTGGVLPAMIWHQFMTFAHTGIQLKPIPFVEPEQPKEGTPVAEAQPAEGEDAAKPAQPSSVLSAATTQRLLNIEKLMLSASRLQPVADLGSAPFTAVAGAETAATADSAKTQAQ